MTIILRNWYGGPELSLYVQVRQGENCTWQAPLCGWQMSQVRRVAGDEPERLALWQVRAANDPWQLATIKNNTVIW